MAPARQLRVEREEQPLVVEHLLEVRNGPAAIDAVAMEAPADLIVEAAPRHLPRRLVQETGDARRLVGLEEVETRDEELEVRGRGELGSAPETAVGEVRGSDQRARRARHGLGARRRRRLPLRSRDECLRDLTRVFFDLGTPIPPGVRERVDHVGERRHPAARDGREIRAHVEGPSVGCADRVQRPAALAVQLESGVHVDLIDVGPFFAIDLDADEGVVHARGDPGILEGLALHDVAPMAGAVADRNEDRTILSLGSSERLFAPGMPVDGIEPMLPQVGTRLVGEPIRGPCLRGAVGSGTRRGIGVVGVGARHECGGA